MTLYKRAIMTWKGLFACECGKPFDTWGPNNTQLTMNSVCTYPTVLECQECGMTMTIVDLYNSLLDAYEEKLEIEGKVEDVSAWVSADEKECPFCLVREFLKGDWEKTMYWFTIPNPTICGGLRPLEMIYLGRHEKLLKYIKDALDGNKPDE